MATSDTTLSSTTSLCPTCLERVPGVYEARDGAVYLTRECADHGVSSRKVWESVDHWEWSGAFSPAVENAGFTVERVDDHRDDLLAIRDRVTERVDYARLLELGGEPGRWLLAGIEALEAAVEDGRVGYVSLVARAE